MDPRSRDSAGTPAKHDVHCCSLSALVPTPRRANFGVHPQLHADDLKCVSNDPEVLLVAARFTSGYVRMVGQEPALGKYVFQ